MMGVEPRREALARRLFEEHRASGGPFWNELAPYERESWIRVARHIEARTSPYIGEAIARPGL